MKKVYMAGHGPEMTDPWADKDIQFEKEFRRTLDGGTYELRQERRAKSPKIREAVATNPYDSEWLFSISFQAINN